MAAVVGATLLKQRGLILALVTLFGLALVAGLAGELVRRLRGHAAPPDDPDKYASMRRLLGRFGHAIRHGELTGTAAAVALLVIMNLVASVLSFTLVSVLILPVIVTLAAYAFMQGKSLARVRPSSWLSLVLFVAVGALEWGTYVLATAAGANLGLSLLWPAHQGVGAHWHAARLALHDAASIYLVILLVLAVQAVAEVLYLRAVLRRGGALVPLRPW
jgi:hypothetical protein